MKKKIFLLLLMLMPLIAFADESGTCGENVKWTYVSSTKTLTISGNGEMKNYELTKSAPWMYKEFQNALIEEGVTSIGEWAFGDCSSTISITIPNSVTSIGRVAFTCCFSLASITIPNSVTEIGSDALPRM